jgi:hypothetical protein
VRGSRSQTLDLVHVRFTSAGWCRSGGCVAREPTVVDGHAVARKSAKSALSVGFMSGGQHLHSRGFTDTFRTK